MREIKFRACYKSDKKMMYRSVYDRNWYTDPKGGKAVITIHPNDQNTMHLMQFTGLKDKNGKEIYEGDILKAKASDVIHPQDLHKVKDEYIISSIYWNKIECCFETDFNAVWFPYSEKTLEVIGNIYQNKELIKTL